MAEFDSALGNRIIVRSAAAVGLAVAAGVGALVDVTPATVNVSAAPLNASGLRLSQVSDAMELPRWLVLPQRSTVPMASNMGNAKSRRIYFTSLETTDDIAFHFHDRRLATGRGNGGKLAAQARDSRFERQWQRVVREIRRGIDDDDSPDSHVERGSRFFTTRIPGTGFAGIAFPGFCFRDLLASSDPAEIHAAILGDEYIGIWLLDADL